jgi:tRNA threonylcarbamoyladenosine biosynthesis protein TsaB
VLAIATSGPRGEVGLLGPGHALVRAALGEGAARGRGLLPAIEALLAREGLAPRDLAAVAVDVGPGSFTGVRVGVTAAKALAWSLSIPVVGVVSLEAIAGHAPAEASVLALRDAGRGQAYFARYGRAVGGARPVEVAPARGGADAVRAAQGDALPAGEEAADLSQRLGLRGPPLALAADAPGVLAEGRRRLERGEAVPPDTLVPLYLQASAPERRLAGEGA